MKSWESLIGHRRIERWFAAAIGKGRLTGSFLFVGSSGVGKRTTAYLLARTLLCKTHAPSKMQPCGVCDACVQVSAGTHPDVVQISKPEDKSFIPLETLIGPPDARMSEGFCRDIRLKSTQHSRKIGIIEDADFLNEEGANCLLKTLEEPPPGALIILIGESEQRQLPTIRSRCQTIRFQSQQGDDALRLLRDVHQVNATDESILDAIELSGGDISAALRLLNGQGIEIRESVNSQLSSPHPDPIAIKRVITQYVDDAGKEASQRRSAMRDVFHIAIQYFRNQIRQNPERAGTDILARLDRSVRALREVDRSANQTTLIECYAADIAGACTGDRGEIGS